MAMDRLKIDSNERVDIEDFRFLADAGLHDNLRQLSNQFFTDPARTRKWILSGFAMSNPAAKQLQVTKGKAILGLRIEGTVKYGTLVSEGDAAIIEDINSFAPGVYGIYIRFEDVAGDNASRVFWNSTGLGSEYTDSIATRYLAKWSLRIEAASPGAEWEQIGTVDQATMAIVDMRNFYFEGKVDDAYESTWSSDGGGVANDRNADRATYGITDLQMFTASMRQALEDIKGRGLKRWWDRDIGGMNIGFDAAPVAGRLAIGADHHWIGIEGLYDVWHLYHTDDQIAYHRVNHNLEFTLNNGILSYQMNHNSLLPLQTGINLGAVGNEWNNFYARQIVAVATATDANAITGTGDGAGVGVIGIGGTTGRGGHFTGGANGAAVRLNIRVTDPSTIGNGDLWFRTKGIRAHINGLTTSLATWRKGPDLVSANDMSTPTHNYQDVVGNTQINTMDIDNLISGTIVVLRFDSNPTVKHNTAGSFIKFFLAGSGDFVAGAGDTLMVAFEDTYWREVSRTVM